MKIRRNVKKRNNLVKKRLQSNRLGNIESKEPQGPISTKCLMKLKERISKILIILQKNGDKLERKVNKDLKI